MYSSKSDVDRALDSCDQILIVGHSSGPDTCTLTILCQFFPHAE